MEAEPERDVRNLESADHLRARRRCGLIVDFWIYLGCLALLVAYELVLAVGRIRWERMSASLAVMPASLVFGTFIWKRVLDRFSGEATGLPELLRISLLS